MQCVQAELNTICLWDGLQKSISLFYERYHVEQNKRAGKIQIGRAHV